MQPVGPAAVISEGQRTQLRKITEMTGQILIWQWVSQKLSSIVKKNPKTTQPGVISWVGKFLYHSHDTLATVLFLSRNANSWLKGRSCLLWFMQLPVVILERSTMTLVMSYLYTSYQKSSVEKWLLVTYIRTRHTEPKWAGYSRNTWGHFIFKFLSAHFQNLLEKKA